MPALSLSLQTGTLYASGETSTFVGTGGPWGFSPYTSQFGGVVSSAGLAGEPFADTVYGVAPGDEVIFVIALQNLTTGQAAYDLGLRAALPAGFAVPADGTNLAVTDGAGTDLAFSGDLFGAGIRLASPVARYDADSGLNLVLVTYTLTAGSALPGPYASVVSTAAITHAATAAGGADQGIATTAATTVVTAAPTPVVQAETSAAAVAKGQSIAFDISIAIPAGTMRDVRLETVLPAGTASLHLVSSTLTGIGSGLTLSTPVFAPDGSVQFGTITSTGDPARNTITLRVVVQADGTASGNALLQTVLSSASTDSAARWSATVGNSVGVVVPPVPPGIAGILGAQQAAPGLAIHPLRGLVLSDSAPNANATLAVTLRDGGLGRLSGAGAGSFNAAGSTFVVTGPLATLQAAARQLVFTATAAGVQQFTLTLVDPSGGVAQDGGTSLVIAGAAADPVVVASGASLYVTELQGTAVLRGMGATLGTDHVTGAPAVIGFGAADRIVLPGTATSFTAIQSGGATTLTLAGTSIRFIGSYDASSFVLVPGDAGTTTIAYRADPLFDAAFYLARNRDIAADGVDPWQHYLASGWREGRDPGALFSSAYYLARNPDVAAAGVNPLLHFEQNGWREGRDPSPLFSDRDYLAAYPDVAAAGVNPVLHYVVSGRGEGRAAFGVSPLPPDPLIDLAYYYAANPDVRNAGANAMDHYRAMGWREGRNPDAWFDSRYYLTQNPDVRAAGVDPLLHYESSGWREGRQTSLLFDGAKYWDANPDARALGQAPLLTFLQSGRAAGRTAFLVGGTAPADQLVDPAFYDAQLGATLIPTGLAALQQAAWSYDRTGWQAGLNPDAWFNTAWYLARYPDVMAAHINPLLHYEQFGWKEGRSPSAAFDTNRYLAANPDVRAAGVNPLLHYVVSGQMEGRPVYPAA